LRKNLPEQKKLEPISLQSKKRLISESSIGNNLSDKGGKVKTGTSVGGGSSEGARTVGRINVKKEKQFTPVLQTSS
jgi:hypothetical protein